MKQIKFYDIENDCVHGGIEMDDGNVVCGCCGGVLEKDEEGVIWKKITEYNYWVDLTEEICGDDLYEE